MLYPSIDEIAKNRESHYSLVIAVSKRARQIAEGNKADPERSREKPVKEAIGEIASGRVRVLIRTI